LGSFRFREKYGNGSSLPSAPGFVSGGLGLSRAEWEKMHGPGGQDPFNGPPDRDGYFVAYSSDGPDGLVAVIAKGYDPKVSISTARAESKSLLPFDVQPIGLNEIDQGSEIYDEYLSSGLVPLFPPGTPRMFPESKGNDIWNNAPLGTITIKYDPFLNNDGTNDTTSTVYMLIYVGGRNK
jgi:hypothetical protein